MRTRTPRCLRSGACEPRSLAWHGERLLAGSAGGVVTAHSLQRVKAAQGAEPCEPLWSVAPGVLSPNKPVGKKKKGAAWGGAPL